MNYPNNKTQLYKFLRENLGLYYRVDHSVRGIQMRRLTKAQTNSFAGLGVDGKQVWLHHDKNLTYVFEGSAVRVITSWCEFTLDFNPTAEEIQAFETALSLLETGGPTA